MSSFNVSSCALAIILTLSSAYPVLGRSEENKATLSDRTLAERAAHDYMEGWYTADFERVGRALHADTVKRYVDALPGGRQVVHTITRDLMIEMTRIGGGSKIPADTRSIIIEALDVSGNIAVVRASSSEYVEYLSLAKCNGQWAIVNILWRSQSPDTPPRQR